MSSTSAEGLPPGVNKGLIVTGNGQIHVNSMAIGDGAQATSTTTEPLPGEAIAPTEDATPHGGDTDDTNDADDADEISGTSAVRHLFDRLHPPL